MKSDIFLALLEKQALNTDTIVTAIYNVTDMFGRKFNKTTDFKISNIFTDADKIIFDLIALTDNHVIKVGPESIIHIDGMDILRYADIYDLLPDGSTKKVGKKRGRKPRNRAIEANQ